MKSIKDNKAITLIALIITIIILLIIAGVTIGIGFGDEGIFTKSKIAAKRYDIEQAREGINLSIEDLQIEKVSNNESLPSLDEIVEKLYNDKLIIGDLGVNTVENSVIVITPKGYRIKITGNVDGSGYNVEYLDDIDKKELDNFNKDNPELELSLNTQDEDQDTVKIIAKAKDEEFGINKLQLIDVSGKVTETIEYEKGKTTETKEFEVSENGVYKVRLISNIGKRIEKEIKVENILEVLTIVPSTTDYTNQDITLTVNWVSNDERDKKEISVDGTTNYKEYTGKEKVEKNTNVYVKLTKANGKEITGNLLITNIDKMLPKPFDQEVKAGLGTITVKGKTEDEEATDEYGKSGIDIYKYKLDAGEWKTNQTGEYIFEGVEAGTHTVTMIARDVAGNETEVTNKDEKVEVKTFESYQNEIVINVTEPNIYTKTKTVTVTWPSNIENLPGITKKISIDGEQKYENYTKSIDISKNCTIFAKMEYEGKEITASMLVTMIDSEGPEIKDVSFNEETLTLTAKVKDDKSGLASIKLEKLTSKTEASTTTQTTVLKGDIDYQGTTEEQEVKERISVPYTQYVRGYIITARDKLGNETVINKSLCVQNNNLVITNAQELQEFANTVNSGAVDFTGITVELGDDIDLEDVENFIPIGQIGTSSKNFQGTFNGNGHTIKNLKIVNRTEDYTGLFGSICEATIENVKLENYNITASGNRVGGLVGYNNGGTIKNVSASGTISNSNNSAKYIGGLVGYNVGEINKASANVKIEASGNYVGGLVGENDGTTIAKSYTEGEVISKTETGVGGSNIGGFLGENSGNVENCYSKVKVNGKNSVGGLVGINWKTIKNCYAIGEVTATKTDVGGLVGLNDATIKNSITNSYWDKDTTHQSEATGGTGYTTAQMKTKNSYSGWDFSTVWEWVDNDYPRLK